MTDEVVLARFWQKVDMSGGPDACWPWTAGTTQLGYGVFHPRKPETTGAHRYALGIALGRPVARGMYACHHCDNPPCCNPSHLYEGTHQDNVNDAVARGRNITGVRVPSAKLNPDAVLEIRNRFAAGETITSITAAFGISLAAGSNVINGRTWRHVAGPISAARRGRRTDKQRNAA